MKPLAAIVLCVCVSAPFAVAQEHEREREQRGKRKETSKEVSKAAPEPAQPPSITEHEITMDGERIAYRATAGYMPMKTEKGELTANIFFIAYEKKGVADPATRPVTYVFNGGPGSSSVWLHMGTVGPRRVLMSDEGKPLAPPGRLVDNGESWLDFTDLVFIDPAGTGFSRPAKGHSQSEFSGLDEDTRSVGDFIRLWTTRNSRWASPKYLAGESYGTTRAASLSGHLQGRYGMYLNGIVLVSAVLNFQTIRGGRGNDLPNVLFLPTFAATAWYHKRLDADLQADLGKTLREVKAFAIDEYLVALAKGDRLTPAARATVAKKLSRYTGISREYLEQANLRLSMSRFAKELLRDERRTVGRLDSRFRGIDRDAAGARYDYDSSMAAIDGPYSSAVKDYFRRELKYENDIHYQTLGGVGRWKYPEGRYVDVADTLRRAMTTNRNLKVLVCSGYFDLATPFFAADYTVSHLGLDPALRGHIRTRYYEAGHMMYIHTPSRQKLRTDVKDFYAWKPAKPAAKKAVTR